MRRFTMIVAMAVVLALPSFAEKVTPETARKAATTFLTNNGAKSTQLTDLSKAAGFPNLYIFTTENSFVMMSADDCAQPILGYSLSDKFYVDDMPENLRWWLQQYSDEIQWGIENGIHADKSTANKWEDLKEGKATKDTPTVVVEPLLTTKWDQGSPYNMYCPTGTVTGCVATAMAQVMKYWNYPTQGQGSHTYTPEAHPEYGEQSVNFGETTYDWGYMTDTYNSSSSNEAKQAVAKLMYHCGVSVNMNYRTSSEGGSGAVSSNVPAALIDYFRYAPSATYKSKVAYTDEQWITILQSELDENRPVFYSGQSQKAGHAFVCDGYLTDNYFHFNWGWGGSHNNEYFLINALNPGSGGTGSGSGYYNLYNGAVFWVEPISDLATPILSATAANGAISLEWNAITEANSYDIYRDNVKIASNITENNYTDNDVVSGVYYEYYVRAVSGETKSNPSNRVTKMPFLRDYTPADLFVTTTEDLVALTWTEPANHSTTLQYATGYNQNRFGMGPNKQDTYWAEVFAPSRLIGFEGMYIEKVSVYCYLDGVYTLMIYEDDCEQETNKLCEQTISVSSRGWGDIVLTTPILLDCTKQLWIIMHYPYMPENNETYLYPAATGNYDEIPYNVDEEDEYFEERYNPRLIKGSLTEPWYYLENNYSWLMRTYISDGTYTYNIYDGETKLNRETITGSSYTHKNPADNTVHHYTVTTNYYGGESEASNTANLALGTVSIENLTLEDNNTMTVSENSTLTVTGTLSNDNPENLILEDGAQIIHSSEGVKATVKKDIAAWTTETPVGGWYFIASPINSTELAPNNVDYMLTDENESGGSRTYDLYRLENGNWKNYRKETFNLTNGKGYLYANESPQTLSFKGEIKPYDAENDTVTISSGWNLIGNPFTCNVVPNMAYHTLNNGTSTTSVNADEGLVAPGMGIAVYSENGGTLSFNLPTEGASASSNGNLQMTLTQQITNRNSTNAITIDNAIVNFDESEGLPKFNLLEANSKLYIPNGDKEYAIVSAEAKGEMPLNFKPSQDGTFTLTIQPESVEMSYLFLIDNLTGCHTNLLTTPNYTFESKTSDYESRFKLLFATAKEETETSENESFGFITNGQFLSTNGQGLLQVIDLNGRVVRSANEVDCIGLDGLTAGVYVIRFITTNSVKTQKIVVE